MIMMSVVCVYVCVCVCVSNPKCSFSGKVSYTQSGLGHSDTRFVNTPNSDGRKRKRGGERERRRKERTENQENDVRRNSCASKRISGGERRTA